VCVFNFFFILVFFVFAHLQALNKLVNIYTKNMVYMFVSVHDFICLGLVSVHDFIYLISAPFIYKVISNQKA
jgi:hypothetical protein